MSKEKAKSTPQPDLKLLNSVHHINHLTFEVVMRREALGSWRDLQDGLAKKKSPGGESNARSSDNDLI